VAEADGKVEEAGGEGGRAGGRGGGRYGGMVEGRRMSSYSWCCSW
jgi:hypothetical protein